MPLGLPNLACKCFMTSLGNPFILESTVKVLSCENSAGVGLCTLVSAGFF